jgi:HPt (histidine-containing phosphotransfer) domain-containing protein
VDSDLQIPEEIRQNYLVRRQNDLETLRSSLANQDLTEFKRIGHQLKGNAASFGYIDLEKIAIALEKAAVDSDCFEASRQLELFENWCSVHQ